MSTLSRIHRRWLPVAVLTVVLFMAVVLFVARPSLAKPVASGSISGRVVAEAGGAPLVDASVYVLTPTFDFVRDTRTNADGGYTVTGLESGSFIVGISPTGAMAGSITTMPVTMQVPPWLG